jgi:hypothetical protein
MPEQQESLDPVSVRIRAYVKAQVDKEPPFTEDEIAQLHTLFLPAMLRAMPAKKGHAA